MHWLPPIPDGDTMADLYHAITEVEALNYCARFDSSPPSSNEYNCLVVLFTLT